MLRAAILAPDLLELVYQRLLSLVRVSTRFRKSLGNLDGDSLWKHGLAVAPHPDFLALESTQPTPLVCDLDVPFASPPQYSRQLFSTQRRLA